MQASTEKKRKRSRLKLDGAWELHQACPSNVPPLSPFPWVKWVSHSAAPGRVDMTKRNLPRSLIRLSHGFQLVADRIASLDRVVTRHEPICRAFPRSVWSLPIVSTWPPKAPARGAELVRRYTQRRTRAL